MPIIFRDDCNLVQPHYYGVWGNAKRLTDTLGLRIKNGEELFILPHYKKTIF
jgi:hypothetical protein